MKPNSIIQGECIQIMSSKFDKGSIDLIFADPPYNLSGKPLKLKGNKTGGDWEKVNEAWDQFDGDAYSAFSLAWISAAAEILKNSGSMFVCCTHHNLEDVLRGVRLSGLQINNIITWQKSNPMPNTTKRLLTHSTEFIIWAVKGKGWTFNANALRDINPDRQQDGSPRMMRDVWTLPVVQGKERVRDLSGKALHPTQKPEEIVRRVVIASSNRGETVLDPFIGSGTTAVVCEREGRLWYGIEREGKYVKAARERIRQSKKRR